MATRLSDSRQYQHLWSSHDLAQVFEERARLASWLTIITALAKAQARLGIIPATSAEAIAAHADVDQLDLDLIAEQTRTSSHSTLGLIHALQQVLPKSAREHVYYGATVQDVTDTWFALAMRDVGRVVWRQLRDLEGDLLDLAEQHRDTQMLGRTHGQPGSPITFGYKVACWADEIRRHIERLQQGRSRWIVGQLAGAVGVLGFFEPDGLALRREFCTELGLGEPPISWLTTRDRIAEFGTALAMVATTLARIGNEVYELARPEIGELHEAARAGTVGSITMPHKRNPESSEHLDTLARLVRANAAVLLEGMAGTHERDGRSWKAEWIALPEVCLLTGVALQTARTLVSGLDVDADAMYANLTHFRDRSVSERLLAGLSPTVGKHHAQELLHGLVAAGHTDDLGAALVGSGAASATDVQRWAQQPATGAATVMTDQVVRAARASRAVEPEEWA